MTIAKNANQPRKGRGAVSNMEGRYEVRTHEGFDDGWHREEEAEFQPPVFVTEVTEERAKTIHP